MPTKSHTGKTPGAGATGEIFRDIVRKCAHALVSRDGCGYWQGNHRQGESLVI